MSDLAHIARHLFNTPLMLRPEKAEVICAALMDRLGIVQLDRVDGTSLDAADLRNQASAARDTKPAAQPRYYDVIEGVALIPVDGTLTHKVGGLNAYSGMVGYNQITAKMRQARADPEVGCLFFDLDTPGGGSAGLFELAKEIEAGSARYGGKPVVMYANEEACSAGYMIMSAGDHGFMPESAIVGSIGVWCLLAEYTAAFKKGGVKVAMMRAGERKARGGPYEKWDQQTLDKISAWIEQSRQTFATLVAGNRGLKVQDVLATEGDWFTMDDPLRLGLVDGIGSQMEVFAGAAKLASDYLRRARR